MTVQLQKCKPMTSDWTPRTYLPKAAPASFGACTMKNFRTGAISPKFGNLVVEWSICALNIRGTLGPREAPAYLDGMRSLYYAAEEFLYVLQMLRVLETDQKPVLRLRLITNMKVHFRPETETGITRHIQTIMKTKISILCRNAWQ